MFDISSINLAIYLKKKYIYIYLLSNEFTFSNYRIIGRSRCAMILQSRVRSLTFKLDICHVSCQPAFWPQFA